MNKITLIRPEESINRSYAYPVFINGEHITDLPNNTDETLSLDTDSATFKAKVGWGGSNAKEISFQDTNHITLQIYGNRFYNSAIRYIGAIFPLLVGIWFLAFHIPSVKYGVPILGILLLLFAIYTLTIDKKNWLRITEIES